MGTYTWGHTVRMPATATMGLALVAVAALLAPTSAFAPIVGVAASSPALVLRTVSVRPCGPAPLALSMVHKGETAPGNFGKLASSLALSVLLLAPTAAPAAKEQLGGNFKVLQGAASTQDSGSRRTITRGAVLDRSDFSNQNLAGVSFQQSLCRECDFENTILKGASFFDGDLTQANMEGADVSNVNFELACMKDANLKNAIVNEAYILGSTKLDGINIEGADFSDTFLRKDQQRYLCERASGTNPTTGVDTKDSLMCSQVKKGK